MTAKEMMTKRTEQAIRNTEHMSDAICRHQSTVGSLQEKLTNLQTALQVPEILADVVPVNTEFDADADRKVMWIEPQGAGRGLEGIICTGVVLGGCR